MGLKYLYIRNKWDEEFKINDANNIYIGYNSMFRDASTTEEYVVIESSKGRVEFKTG